jgi:hypothetical protein
VKKKELLFSPLNHNHFYKSHYVIGVFITSLFFEALQGLIKFYSSIKPGFVKGE